MRRVVLPIVCLLMFACRAAPPRVTTLGDTWLYARTPPRSTPPASGWSGNVAGDPRTDLWFRHPLPAVMPDDARMVTRAYIPAFVVYVDATPVYTFDDPGADSRLTLHVVELPPHSAGRMLYVRVPHAGEPPYFGGNPLLATRGTLSSALVSVIFAPFRVDAGEALLGIALAVSGLLALLVSALRRDADRTLRLFGWFTLLYGTRVALQTAFPIALGARWSDSVRAAAIITYIINIPAWMLTRELMGDGWRGSLRWLIRVFVVFAPIGVASDWIAGRAESLDAVNHVLVIAAGLIVAVNLLVERRLWTRELRVVVAGALAFLLFSMNNNLARLGVLPWQSAVETPGFLLFAAALGYAATVRFVRGERERLAIDNELATAREIQQSILPPSMPEVAGLRVDARYVPASSVAGDLYDFLRVGATHAGVFVGDVAGHGVPAALIASMAKIAVTSQERLADDPAALLDALNRTLARDLRRGFLTATYLWFDAGARRVTVANAGHPPPLLVRGDTFLELGPPSPLLGRFRNATYTAAAYELAPGDRIVAYTDGILEARNARDEMFGEERFRDVVRRNASPDAVIDAVVAWRGEASEDADDLTLVVIDVGAA
ncbi:MAG: PP2C family protein-serine/threonine phosphatase [Acidobacteria bacterium]|nr:PP2C family protein-serine/threonine phosphatase [Acidobacteriota bacterium]